MPGTPFAIPKTVRLDANGEGQAEVFPSGEVWEVTTTTVSSTSTVKKPQANIYLNGQSIATYVQGTFTGTGDTSDIPMTVQPGGVIYATWTGGDPGATATLRVAGRSYPPGTMP